MGRPRHILLPLQELRKCNSLSNLNYVCKIDWDIGHSPPFCVAKTRKAVSEKQLPMRYWTTKWEIYSEETPNFSDLDVFLGVIKIFQAFPEKCESKGTRVIGVKGRGYKEVEVTGITLSKNRLCEYFGKAKGGKSHREVVLSLSRLRSTTIYQDHKENGKRQFRLVTDFTWRISEAGTKREDNAEILMDAAFLERCQNGYKFKWKALQGLKSQVAKGLLFYLMFHNPPQKKRKNQALTEARIFKYLYRLKKPKFEENVECYDLSEILQHDAARRQRYAIEMKEYRKTCREYRRQITDALNILKSQGIIHDYFRVPKKDKVGRATERRLWLVTKGDYLRPPVTTDPKAIQQPTTPTTPQDYDDQLPF